METTKLNNLTESLERLYEEDIPNSAYPDWYRNGPNEDDPDYIDPIEGEITIPFNQRFSLDDYEDYWSSYNFEEDFDSWVEDEYYDDYDNFICDGDWVVEELDYVIQANKEKLPFRPGVYRIRGTITVPCTIDNIEQINTSRWSDREGTDYTDYDLSYDNAETEVHWKKARLDINNIEKIEENLAESISKSKLTKAVYGIDAVEHVLNELSDKLKYWDEESDEDILVLYDGSKSELKNEIKSIYDSVGINLDKVSDGYSYTIGEATIYIDFYKLNDVDEDVNFGIHVETVL